MTPIVVRSQLRVSPETLWGEQSLATVNYELGPWIHMTTPAGWGGMKLKDWRADGPLFASWILLLGVVPLDRHAFGSLDVSQPMRFVETSTSWVNKVWRHERVVTAIPSGCEVVDTVSFTPRLPLVASLLRPVYALVFRHRHARLKARDGTLGN